MMRDSNDDPLERLSDAVDAFVEFREAGAESADELLARHSELRDLLEPMLAADDGRGDVGGALRVGAFRVERELGRGGMGIVYEAVDEALGRRVALKLLPPELSLSPRRLTRFRREAAVIAKLDHPGIVRVHQVGETDGRHFIAMELVTAQSLEERLHEVHERASGRPEQARELVPGATLSYPLQVAEVCQKAAAALAHAHEHDVVHRDVKPSNILFHEDGRVCLADFGLAFDAESAGLSRSGDFVGTPYYVSPEQLTMRGRGADPRMDVFALGVVLYEALTFAHPFDGETTEEVLYAITHRDPVPPSRINPMVPRDLETVCLRAMTKDPGRRYPSARAMADDLGRVVRREPIAARPAGRLERLISDVRRRPARAVAIAAVGLIVFSAPLAGMLHLKLSRDAVLEEQGRTETQRRAAVRNLERARSILDELMTEIADGALIADPEGQALRHRILESAARYHDDMARESPTVVVLLDAARAHGRLGRVAQQTGERDAALAAYSRSIELFEEVEAEVDSDVARADHAATHLRRALLNGEMGRVDRAGPEFEEARAILEAFLEEGDAEVAAFAARELTRGLRRRGAQLRRAGRVADARASYDEARRKLAVWEASSFAEVVGDPASLRLQAALLDFESARLALDERQLDAAEAGFEAARAALEELAGSGNWWAANELPTVTFSRAQVAAARGEAGRAMQMEEEAVAQLEEFVARYPSSLGLRRRLVEQLTSYGRRLLGASRVEEARDHAARALRLADELVEAAPDRPLHLAALGGALMVSGAVQRFSPSPDRDAILADFERACACYEELVARWPDATEYQRELAGAISNCAECRFSLEPSEPEAALALLQRAIELQRAVLDAAAGDRMARAYLRNHVRLLGKVGLRLDDRDTLLEVARHMRALAGDEPSGIVAATTWLVRSGRAQAASRDDTEAADAEAVQWLADAVRFGYDSAKLTSVTGLEVLADHPRFRALVEAR